MKPFCSKLKKKKLRRVLLKSEIISYALTSEIKRDAPFEILEGGKKSGIFGSKKLKLYDRSCRKTNVSRPQNVNV